MADVGAWLDESRPWPLRRGVRRCGSRLRRSGRPHRGGPGPARDFARRSQAHDARDRGLEAGAADRAAGFDPGGRRPCRRRPRPRPSRPGHDAERRQLTVMFCDMVGSTALAARLDPEDLHEVMRRYQETCAEVVARFEGHVGNYIGDGILAYFGYPKAHEDDALRAIRAALDIVEAIKRLNDDLDDLGRRASASGSGSTPASWWPATSAPASSATAWRWSARPRTSRRACKGSRSRARSWSASAPAGCSRACSSSTSWARR